MFGELGGIALKAAEGGWLRILGDLLPELTPAIVSFPDSARCEVAGESRQVRLYLDGIGLMWIKFGDESTLWAFKALTVLRGLTFDEAYQTVIDCAQSYHAHDESGREITMADYFTYSNDHWRPLDRDALDAALGTCSAFIHGCWSSAFRDLLPELGEAIDKAPAESWVNVAGRAGMFRFDPYFDYNGRAYHREIIVSKEMVLCYVKGWSREEALLQLAQWMASQPDESTTAVWKRVAHDVLDEHRKRRAELDGGSSQRQEERVEGR